MIYADNAATTRVSKKVRSAYISALGDFGNPSSAHKIGDMARARLKNAREVIAMELGCNPSEIIFTSGGTESDNMALFGAARLGEKRGKRHIVSTVIEHHAVLHTLDRLKEQGFEVTLVGVDENGCVSVEDIESAIRDDTCLVSVMYANNEIGTIQPIKKIGELCRKKGVLFHTDAVQAVGHVKINVKKENIDMLSISAHKFHGVKGVGALFVRSDVILPPLLYGGAQERNQRAGTENVAGIHAMAVALQEAYNKIEEKFFYVSCLRHELQDRISDIEGIIINGNAKNRLAGILNITIPNISSNTLTLFLNEHGICVSSGSACTTGTLEPSHVISAIRHDSTLPKEAIRISLDEYNTIEDVIKIADAIKKTVSDMKE